MEASIEPEFAEFSSDATIFLYFTCISYGALCAQAYEYFVAFRDDSRFLKAATAAVMILETLHIAVTVHTIYYYAVVVADNPLGLLEITWDAAVIILVDTFVVLIVQIYYIRRIWILSKKSLALVALLGAMVCGRCGLELTAVAYLWSLLTRNYFVFWTDRITFIIYISWMSLGALGDVLVAVAIGTFLVRKRTGFGSTDTIIRKAVALSINSGAITAAVAVATLVTFITLGSHNIVNSGLSVFASGLYANSFFGMLNARQLFRKTLEADNGPSQLLNQSSVVFRDHVGTNTSMFRTSRVSRPEV